MVTLSIRLDQEYPEGVLQLSDTEAALTFQHNTNMMAVACHLMAVTVWWGEPVVLCILPQRSRQVREYITKRSSHPSGALKHMWCGGVGIQPLPSMPSRDEGLSEAQALMPQVELTRDVWDLNNDQLWEALEVLLIKMAWREGQLLGSPWGNLGPLGVKVKP